MFREFIKKILQQIRISFGIVEIKTDLNIIKSVAIENYISRELKNNSRFKNKKRLNQFEYQVFSQFGEDGIISEIFNRIKTTNKFFIEIGAGEGQENNTINLLLNNWKGMWIESDKNAISLMKKYYSKHIKEKKLIIKKIFVTKENIINFFKSNKVPNQFDLLSIDIDGNDYWIWEKLSKYSPRVVVIEYNSSLGPTSEWIMEYSKNHKYDNTNYHGASLKSLELLGKKMGYKLVGCSFAGVNAFFVRNDLIKNKFLSPFTSENFYEPPRYFTYKKPGHPRSVKLLNNYFN